MLTFATVAFSAHAAEIVFPGISRIGLVPPAGMHPANRFSGFEQRESDAAVLLNELPKEAYEELSKSLSDQLLSSQGLQVISRGKLDGMKSDNILVVTEQKIPGNSIRRYTLVSKGEDETGLVTVQLPANAQKIFRDADIRKSLATYNVRPALTPDQQLQGLPFKLGDMDGFHLVRTFAGNAAMLTDGPADNIKDLEQPTAVVAATFTPIPANEREAFGKRVLNALPQLKEIRIEGDETTGAGESQTSELIGSARATTTGELMLVFQSLRYTKDGYLRLVGQGKLDNRETLVARFRKMAMSLQPK